MYPTKRMGLIKGMNAMCALALLLAGAAEAHTQSPFLPQRTGEWVPTFSIAQAIYTPIPGQFSLSRDGQFAVFGKTGRYFGHPVAPDFGPGNNLELVRIATGERTTMTAGDHDKSNPRFSPDGLHVAYESDGAIWSVDVGTGEMKRLTLSPSSDRAPAWSPDGTQIAFISGRRGGSTDRTGTRVWVMSAEGEMEGIRVLTENSLGYSDLQWSPDGRWLLATASEPGDHIYSNAIFRVDVETGETRRLTPNDGYYYQHGRWSPDGTTVALLSDRQGYLNIWLMAPDGQELRPLTPSPEEQYWSHRDYLNETPVWSPDGTRLLYLSIREGNCDLWMVEVQGGDSTRLSTDDGCHHPVGWVRDDAVAFVAENYFTPPDLHVHDLESADTRKVTHSSHASWREAAFGRLERVSFESADGLQISGYLLAPEGLEERESGTLPGIVMLHTYNPGQFYHWFDPIFNYIVASGYTMLKVDQRGSVGYGRDFSLMSIGEWGGGQVDDVTAGAEFLASQPFVDSDRIGVMGYSFGGFQTYWSLIRTPELYRAGVSLFGPADRRNRPQPSAGWELQIGAPEREAPEMWEAVSPAAHASAIQAPVLMIGGQNDRIVHVGQTYTMAAELERAGKQFELVMYPDEEHGLDQLDHQLDSVRRVIDFFDRFLKP